MRPWWDSRFAFILRANASQGYHVHSYIQYNFWNAKASASDFAVGALSRRQSFVLMILAILVVT